MYYEETKINGVWMWRKWTRFTALQRRSCMHWDLLEMAERARKARKEGALNLRDHEEACLDFAADLAQRNAG